MGVAALALVGCSITILFRHDRIRFKKVNLGYCVLGAILLGVELSAQVILTNAGPIPLVSHGRVSGSIEIHATLWGDILLPIAIVGTPLWLHLALQYFIRSSRHGR